jgi:hypothetical protein
MKRRHFVQAGISAVLIPGAVIAGPTVTSSASDYFFFDERFARAQRLADWLSGVTTLTPVQGDVTPTWTGGLARASLTSAMTLKGVTTESFYFCLKILLGDQARVDAQVRRVDRDLHLWTMHTDNYPENGTVSWQNHSRRA